MKTYIRAYKLLSLVIISLFASCVYDESGPGTANNQSETYLNLSFLAQPATATRAADGHDDNLANPSTESTIHSIRVWAFSSSASSGNAIAASYREEILATPINGEKAVKTLSMKIPQAIGEDPIQKLDLFILANAESVEGLSQQIANKKLMTRKQLEDLVISSSFGISNEGKAQTTAVPSMGLPFSRVITNISVADHVASTETGAAAKSLIIPLVRAVSKLHFFFARKSDGGTEEALISKIVLNEGIIPTESYVFPDAATYTNKESSGFISTRYANSTSYFSNKLNLEGVENKYITSVEKPTIFQRGENERAEAYMQRLSEAGFISHHRTYLRESNKPISGKIYYKQSADSPEQSVDFTIPSNLKPAARNHELVVYGYFLEGGKLEIKPTLLDWEDGGKYDYTDKVEIHTIVEGDYQTQDNCIEVAHNDPSFGPKFTFEDINTGGRKWTLQSSNPIFGFVIVGDESGEVKDYIQGNGYKESISFYVVPKHELDMAKPHNNKAHIFLTVGTSKKALINVGEGDQKLPGTSTEIHFIQVK